MIKKYDINVLNKYIEDKWIMKQSHPNKDLHIYNYTQFTQYERKWDEITLACRGLVLDSEGRVISKGFNKFFNASEHESAHLPDLPLHLRFTVTSKLDGSLLIVFKYNDEIVCASRGSFTSEQAVMGAKIISKKKNIFKDEFTYLFELIYPFNRIVCDYGDKEDVILLGIINNETGIEIDHDKLTNEVVSDFEIVKQLNGIKDFSKIKDLISDDEEGFVITFENGVKCKIKGDEYVRLHRLITEFSNKSIWNLLRKNQPFDEFLDRVPDEFFDWVKNTKQDLENQYKTTFYEVIDLFNDLKNLRDNRKAFAQEVFSKYKKYSNFMFAMLDANLLSLNKSIWKSLKPKFEKPFKK